MVYHFERGQAGRCYSRTGTFPLLHVARIVSHTLSKPWGFSCCLAPLLSYSHSGSYTNCLTSEGNYCGLCLWQSVQNHFFVFYITTRAARKKRLVKCYWHQVMKRAFLHTALSCSSRSCTVKRMTRDRAIALLNAKLQTTLKTLRPSDMFLGCCLSVFP